MKINRWIAVCLLLLSSSAFSCRIPIQGDEYNKLIDVEWSEFEETFYIIFPTSANGQTFDNVMLNIQNASFNVGEASAPLHTFTEKGKLVTSVTISDNLDIELSVSVWWQGKGDICPIIGTASLTKE